MVKATKKGAGVDVISAPKKQQKPDYATVKKSQRVLEATPGRVLKFIMAVNKSKALRAALEERGFSAAVRRDGFERVGVVAGFGPDESEQDDFDPVVRDAIVTIDAGDEDLVAVTGATLQHEFPEQYEFVMNGVSAKKGSGSVATTMTMLDRFDALENGKGRESSRAQDRAALKALGERGFDAEYRKKARALVNTAMGVGLAPAKQPSAAEKQAEAEREAEYQRSLRAVRAWWEQWSGVARSTVKRRDYLVNMGLAVLKKRGAVEVLEPVDEEAEAEEAEAGNAGAEAGAAEAAGTGAGAKKGDGAKAKKAEKSA